MSLGSVLVGCFIVGGVLYIWATPKENKKRCNIDTIKNVRWWAR